MRGSSNPVLTRAFPDRGLVAPPQFFTAERLTIDDVVVHTAGLLGLLTVVAGVTWKVVPEDLGFGLLIPAFLVTVGLVIYAAVKREIPPAVAITYAVVEGFLVGVISRAFNNAFEGTVGGGGIVLQAVIATVAVFSGMLVLYRTGTLRATPRFRKIVMTATLGIFVTYMLSFVMRLFGAEMPLLNSSSPLGILISVAIVCIAAFNLILDFDQIESAVAAGAPRQFAWTAAFGLMVTIIWLYLELLRLLSKLQSRD
jgi:uncharacterized YccA/Bax inhibitor family protein